MDYISIISCIFIVILFYYALLSVWYIALLIASFPVVINTFKVTNHNNIIKFINRDALIPLTIVTPAFNETKRINNMIQSIFRSSYKNLDLIIVNDGSTDNMMEFLIKEYDLVTIPQIIKQKIQTSKILNYYQSLRFPNLYVIDKEHSPYGNGADSVNAGLNACKTPLFITVDADTVLEPNALSELLFTFLSHTHCVSVGGSCYVLNENRVENGVLQEKKLPRKFVPAVQAVEYLRSFLYGRSGWNYFGGAMCYPGAFTLFETQILREVGGYDTKNFAYDAEIVTKIHHWMRKHKYPNCLLHTPNAFSWTEVPSTLKKFWRQRNLWQRGMWKGALLHAEMLFNLRYGVVGLISFPAYVLFEIIGPLVEFISYSLVVVCFFLHIFTPYYFAWYFLLAWSYITLLSLVMILLNQITFKQYNHFSDSIRVVWLVFAELLGFRQFRAVCCFAATVHYIWNRLRGRYL